MALQICNSLKRKVNQLVSSSLERDLQSHVFVLLREGLIHPLMRGDGGRDATHHSLASPTGLLGPPGPVLKAPRVYPQSSMRELVESGRYDTREDFSVVLQPFFRNIRLPVLAVRSLLSPLGLLGGGRRNSRQSCQGLSGECEYNGEEAGNSPGAGLAVQPPWAPELCS